MKTFLERRAATEELPAHFVAWGEDSEKVVKKTNIGQVYKVDLKSSRNPKHHRKMFALFRLVFKNLPENKVWESHGELFSTKMPSKALLEIGEETASRIFFINSTTDILKLCKWEDGLYDVKYLLGGRTMVEFQSISFESMSQEKFNLFYDKSVNTCLKYLIQLEKPEERMEFERQVALEF